MKKIIGLVAGSVIGILVLIVATVILADAYGFMPGGVKPCIHPITCGANCTPETPCIGVAE